jgi:hypothetical protein
VHREAPPDIFGPAADVIGHDEQIRLRRCRHHGPFGPALPASGTGTPGSTS